MKKLPNKKELPEGQPERRAGVLLSISSLPGPGGIGGLGEPLRQFLDWMHRSGLRTLSLLPLGPTSFGNSPYQSPSAFAGNPYYISLQELYEEGLLSRDSLEAAEVQESGTVDYGLLYETRPQILKKAFCAFAGKGGLSREDYRAFCSASRDWLDDFAAYMAIKEAMGGQPWQMWPPELAHRREPAFSQWREENEEALEFWKFTQFVFFSQWERARAYANEKGIEVIGDMPFYVAADSADVWSRPELFAVDPETGKTEMWAGVPADDFSGCDRNWGNPVYNWKNHRADGYQWFRRRVRLCGRMYDVLRIDHVIAMMRYFGIRDGETAGDWYDGPEAEDCSFSHAVCQEAEAAGLSIIAEDLGKVPEGLRERLEENGWPGMRVLQFAFTGKYEAKSNHLPFYHRQDMVVYTGTHDNPTLKTFLEEKSSRNLRYMHWWTHTRTREELHGALLKEAYKSPANRAIIPLQDFLGLGGEAQMVYSEDYERSWKWRLSSLDALDWQLSRRLKRLAVLTGRCAAKDEAEFAMYLGHWHEKG